jgi:hypothetical protein
MAHFQMKSEVFRGESECPLAQFQLHPVSHRVLLHSTEVFRSSYFSKYMLFYCPCPSSSDPIRAHQNCSTFSGTCHSYVGISCILDKEKTGTVKKIISVQEQDVNALQVSQHSQPALEQFVVAVAARQAANFRSLLNASYFW